MPRLWPRSRPTTFKPAFVSSEAMMPPTQPTPTITTSTSGSATSLSSCSYSRALRQGPGLHPVGLHLEDVLAVLEPVCVGVPGGPEPLPPDEVVIASV